MGSDNLKNKQPRLAVIGAGNWGMNHVKTLHQLEALYAVAEASEEQREKLKAAYPNISLYGDHEELLADKSIKGVVVATPAFTHHAIAREALLSGKDVLVEKPMAMNVSQVDELTALAAEGKSILMVGHVLLYCPAVQAIKKIIKEGVIGSIMHLEMRRLKLGKVRSEENVFWSFAPHDLAVMLHLVESDISSLKASGINAIQPAIADDVHGHFVFENKTRAHIHASWLWPEIERKTVIVGTRGMIVYDEYRNEAKLFRKRVEEDLTISDEGSEEIVYQKSAPLLTLEDSHFIECIKERTEPITNGESGRKVIEILMKMDEELRNNEKNNNR